MTNHVHLLLTPRKSAVVPGMGAADQGVLPEQSKLAFPV